MYSIILEIFQYFSGVARIFTKNIRSLLLPKIRYFIFKTILIIIIIIILPFNKIS